MFGVRTGDRGLKHAVDLAGGGGAGRLSRRRFVPGAAAGVFALSVPGLLALPGGGAASAQAAALQPEDALHRRVRAALARVTGRLRENGVDGYDGYDGEVGWPDDYAGDADQWNALAEVRYADADEANLWVAQRSTREWWGTGYKLAPYEDRHSPGDSPNGVDSANTRAAVTGAHPSTPSYLRGVVNVSAPSSGTRSPPSPRAASRTGASGATTAPTTTTSRRPSATSRGGGTKLGRLPQRPRNRGRRRAAQGFLAGPARNGPRRITINTGRGR